MSDDRRRRRIPGQRCLRAPIRERKAGDPNVLSNAAIPNRLSAEGGRPAAVGGGTRESAEGWLATAALAQPRRIPVPSVATLIFLGLLALTAFRFIGEVLEGAPADTPVASQGVGPGLITFGTDMRDDCTVAVPAVVFPAGTEVWWSAELSTEQAPGADAMVVVRYDGVAIDRQYVPADPSVGTWNLLCAAEPVRDGGSGLYRVEVWDGELVLLHAQGEYRVAAP